MESHSRPSTFWMGLLDLSASGNCSLRTGSLLKYSLIFNMCALNSSFISFASLLACSRMGVVALPGRRTQKWDA